MKTWALNRITLAGAFVVVGLIYIVSAVTAQTSEDEDGRPPRYPTYEECMYWENDHEYCEHLLPPTYTSSL